MWQKHIDSVANKLCKATYLMRNLAGNVSESTLRTAYFSLVQCQLQYCVTIWGHSSGVHRLFGLQRRIIRIMAGIGYRDDCRKHFTMLNILTLPCLYIYKCIEYVLNNMNEFKKLKFFHRYDTRTSDICLNVLRLSRTRYGLNYHCIKFYNCLPHEFRKQDPKVVNSAIKNYLISRAFYSLEEYYSSNFNELSCTNRK